MLSLGTPASCEHIVCNNDVVWFPLCCKGPKSPALPRPDAAAGECHTAWHSVTDRKWTNEDRGLLLSYVGLCLSHEAHLCVEFSCTYVLGSDRELRLSLSVYYSPVLCVYALTQIKTVPGWRIGFGCSAYQWLGLSSPNPFVWCVCVWLNASVTVRGCVVSRVDFRLVTVQWRITQEQTSKSRGNMFAGSERGSAWE